MDFITTILLMTTETITYTVFGAVLVLALTFDLGLMSKKNKKVTINTEQ